jgi:hypothetical protein
LPLRLMDEWQMQQVDLPIHNSLLKSLKNEVH